MTTNCENCGASMGQYGVCQYCAPSLVMVKYEEPTGSVGNTILDGICDAECDGIKPTKAVLNPVAYADFVSNLEGYSFHLCGVNGEFKLPPSENLFCYGVTILEEKNQSEAVIIC